MYKHPCNSNSKDVKFSFKTKALPHFAAHMKVLSRTTWWMQNTVLDDQTNQLLTTLMTLVKWSFIKLIKDTILTYNLTIVW